MNLEILNLSCFFSFSGCAPYISHGAESDCLALMRVTAAVGPTFITNMNNNSKKITNYKKMW